MLGYVGFLCKCPKSLKSNGLNHCHHVPAFKLALNLGFYILDTPILSYFGVSKRVLIGSFFNHISQNPDQFITNLKTNLKTAILRQPS